MCMSDNDKAMVIKLLIKSGRDDTTIKHVLFALDRIYKIYPHEEVSLNDLFGGMPAHERLHGLNGSNMITMSTKLRGIDVNNSLGISFDGVKHFIYSIFYSLEVGKLVPYMSNL